jgi:elongator complex protein 5
MSSPLALEQLLNNKKSSSSSSFILLNDTIKFSSLPIIIDIGKRALDQEEEKTLIVLLTEISPALWREQFSAYKRNKIYIIDAYSNPLGWNEADSTDKNVLQVNDIKNMEKSILSPIIKKTMETPNCTILIDSVTPLALISQYRTYQLVKTLESLTTGMLYYMDVRNRSDDLMKDLSNRCYSLDHRLPFRLKVNLDEWPQFKRFI